MEMRRIRYYVGATSQDGGMGSQDVTTEQWSLVEDALIVAHGGFTRLHADGAWTPDPGARVVREPSRIYEILTQWSDGSFVGRVKTIAQNIATLTGQESVLWTVESVRAGFESRVRSAVAWDRNSST